MTILALALGSLIATAPAHETKAEGFSPLSVDEVEAMIAKKQVDVFDNNGKERYAQSHLPTAKWVAFNAVKESDLPKDHSRALVFYCASEL